MPPIDDYESLDALALADRIRRRQVSASEVLEEAIGRAEKRNPELVAIVTPMYEEARAAAKSELPDGPLRGVPFLVKDLNASCSGVRTTSGCKLFADFVPDHDSELVVRYRRAGLVIFGKSASPEFGITTSTESELFGKTRNPWSPAHTAGGSSGGAAAAVAGGILPAAHASDGGGSIRIPASCCGLFGLKPTRARVPAGPDAGEGWSGMSTSHALTRSVRDSAALLDAVAGEDLGAPYYAPPRERPFLDEVGANPGRLRIALQTAAFNEVETHPDCVAAAESAARLCEELGHDVEEARFEIDRDAFIRACQVIIAANLRMTLEDRAAELARELRPDDVEPGTWAMVEAAKSAPVAEYARSLREIHAVGRQLARHHERYDVILTPTMAAPPVKLGVLALDNTDLEAFITSIKGTIAFTQLFNATGTPAASVPLHWNAEGLPIGVQFAARFGEYGRLYRLAGQLEQARPWFDRRPGR